MKPKNVLLENFYRQLEQQTMNKLPNLLDNSGKVYAFDRGVIGINPVGAKIVYNLDDTNLLHSVAVRKVQQDFGLPQPFELNSVVSALSSRKDNLIMMLLEGKSCFLMLPNQITARQFEELCEEIIPRADFSYTYFLGNQAEEEKRAVEILEISSQIIHENFTSSFTKKGIK